jgi:hypothetical protein
MEKELILYILAQPLTHLSVSETPRDRCIQTPWPPSYIAEATGASETVIPRPLYELKIPIPHPSSSF